MESVKAFLTKKSIFVGKYGHHMRRFLLLLLLFHLSVLMLLAKSTAYDRLKMIDSLYVHKPQTAYGMLSSVKQDLRAEGASVEQMRYYETVAQLVCLRNNRYSESYQHSLRLMRLSKESPEDQLGALENMGVIALETGQLTDVAMVIDQMREITGSMKLKSARDRAICCYYQLRVYLLMIESDLQGDRWQQALDRVSEERKLLAQLRQEYPEGISSIHINRHALDKAEIDVYLKAKRWAEAAHMAQVRVMQLRQEQQRGGDGVTDSAGYDIIRLSMLGQWAEGAYGMGQRGLALRLARQVDSLLARYPNSEGVTSRLAKLYLQLGQYRAVTSLAAKAHLLKSDIRSAELRSLINSLIYAYTQLGETNQATRYMKILDSVNQSFIRQQYNLAANSHAAMVENNHLKEDLYWRKLYELIGLGVLLILAGVLVVTRLWHKEHLRNIRYIFRYIKTTSKMQQEADHRTAAQDKDMKAKLRELLQADKSFLQSDFPISQLESKMGMKQYAINQKLREDCQTTLKQLLLELRLEYACQLLETTDYVLEYVALESGFGTLRTFLRQFRNQYDLTPTEYRKLSKQERARLKDADSD